MKIIRPTTITAAMVSSVKINGVAVVENDYPIYDANTVYVPATSGNTAFCISTVTHRIYKALRTNKPNCAISIGAPGVVALPTHNLTLNQTVKFATSGALPTGITAGTTYYVIPVDTNSFQIAATANGAPITTSGSQSGVHTVQFSIDPTTENNATLPYWLDYAPTNKFAAFDEVADSQITGAESIEFILAPGRADSIAFINMEGAAISIQQTVGIETVYDKQVNLNYNDDISDWRQYFYEEFDSTEKLALTDLPPIGESVLKVTISQPGGTVKLGCLIVGMYADLGETQYQPTIGITSYGRKTIDSFGRAILKKGKTADRNNCRMWLPNSRVDFVKKTLAKFDNTLVVWIGAENLFTSLIVYGFYKDFEIELANASSSYCSLQIEGMAQ